MAMRLVKAIPGLLLAMMLLASCSWYEETYKNPDRTCGFGGLSGMTDERCMAFIELACPADQFPQPAAVIQPSIKPATIYVELAEGPQQPLVGDLYANAKPFPIYTKGLSPWQVLQRDVTEILRRQGFLLADSAEQADYLLLADMTWLDVRSEEGGWTDMTGTTRANARFIAMLSARNGETVWQQEFVGHQEFAFVYAYLKDSQSTLGAAYCKTLQRFSENFAQDMPGLLLQ